MNCSVWQDTLVNTGFLSVLASHIAASVLSIILSCIVIVKCGKLPIHVNCRILILAMLILFIGHSLITIGLQGYQLFYYLTLESVCYFAISADVCFVIRFSMIFCMICFASLQSAMVVERYVALYKRKDYEMFGNKLGISLTLISIFIAFASTAWAFRRQEFSAKPYCASTTPLTLMRISVVSIALCGVNLATAAGVAILLISNRIAVNRKRFDLRSSYQLNENYSVIRLLLPLAVFQNISYAFFTISSAVLSLLPDYFTYVTFRILFTLAYIVPFHTLFSSVIIWLIILNSQRLKACKLTQVTQGNDNKEEAYFSAYLKMWR